MTYAIELVRINGRDYTPVHTPIPADSTPEEELNAFLDVMDMIGAPYHLIQDTDAYAVQFQLEGTRDERGQLWRVQVIEIEPPVSPDDTQPLFATLVERADLANVPPWAGSVGG